MKSILFLIPFLLIRFVSPAQKFVPDGQYLQHVRKAYTLYQLNHYMEAALTYDSAFNGAKGKSRPVDRYNAAFTWAFTGNLKKAFDYLENAVYKSGYSDVEKLAREAPLFKLNADSSRWGKLLAAARRNKAILAAKFNESLAAKLKTILEEDQKYRKQIDSVQGKYGLESKEVQNLWATIFRTDSINLIEIRQIVKKWGWPGPEVVGEDGNKALFLVIQHSDSATQEQFLPILRNAIKKGNAKPSYGALLEDRVRVKRGLNQIYGTQVKLDQNTKMRYFYPIADELHVNERRASVELGPIEEYAKQVGINYSGPR
jgi:hypothetical protein